MTICPSTDLKIIPEEKKHQWKLLRNIASNVNKYFEEFILEGNLKDIILTENRVSKINQVMGHIRESKIGKIASSRSVFSCSTYTQSYYWTDQISIAITYHRRLNVLASTMNSQYKVKTMLI